MKIKLLIVLVFGLLNGASLASQADEIINQPHRPKNVQEHYFQSDIEIQIDNPHINVVDLRHDNPVNNLKIVLSPMTNSPSTETIMTVPGQARTAGNPGGLPLASFQSNIPVADPYRLLPHGQSTNILGNPNLATPKNLLVQRASNQIKKLPIALEKSNPLMKYDRHDPPPAPSFLKVNTKVTGELKSSRGDLLRSH